MNIRKPYTITESEKNRIRGLHTNLKNIITESSELNEGPYCPDGCPENHTCTWTGCEPNWSIDDFMSSGKVDDKPSGDRRAGKMEMGETALPTGWTMKTLEEVEEEGYMDDLYEVWSGQEDRDSLSESINDNGTSGEMVYELPGRFGNKRLTESQLIDMINTIIK
jgi:hypothetical protein